MSSKRSQPEWTCPKGEFVTGLKLFNSLTRKKELFVPREGRRVLWYGCGPTVYDDSHMGHARSYISFDIMRRILKDYFQYDVFYVMNITDIDDKIIKRARRLYLFENYSKEEKTISQIIQDIQPSLKKLEEKIAKEDDVDKKNMLLRTQMVAIETIKNKDSISKQVALLGLQDVLCDWLDENLGSSVVDNQIFNELPRKFEMEFHKDMQDLNVLPPDVLTRVSEYVEEIIIFVQNIIKKGYAYQSNNSIYFDTIKFDFDKNHHYCKLVPEAFGDSKTLEEGEGDLSISKEKLKEKKNETDFALWKSSKPGEPFWESPWGKGRPGWHIECSVMATSILGPSLDIHSGGVDLKFPHHDNELAQSEAHFGSDNWVTYFLHSGHLTISGCKMSKSLKNFITIKQALKNNTARQLRLMFLLHCWNSTLDYSESTMKVAISFEKNINEFFLRVKDLRRKKGMKIEESFQKWSDLELQLNQKFLDCKKQVHDCLCDNLDTRGSLESIRDLISDSNIYLDTSKQKEENDNQKHQIDVTLVTNIAKYIKNILNIFGTIETDEEIGFPISNTQINSEEQLMPYLQCLADFREEVREKARGVKATEILTLCDKLRDDVLPELGIKIEDKGGEKSVIKIMEKEALQKEKAEKEEQENMKKKIKEEKMAAQKAKLEAGKIPPSEIFKSETQLYSAFDDKGIPTHDASGEPLTKSQIKKLLKVFENQNKKHLEYLKALQEGRVG